MLLAQRDYPAEAFLFDRSDKSLGVQPRLTHGQGERRG
jgi:hypothetical protein